MRHISFRAILLPIFASCIFGVLTYASVKASKTRNAFEAAFTDLTHILGSLPGEKRPTINAARRSSKGLNVQKPAVDASTGVGMAYAPTSQGKADAMVLQQPSSLATTHPADLLVGIEDDIYGTKGATAFPTYSTKLPSATPRSGESPLRFYGTTATPLASPIISSASTPRPSRLAPQAPAPITHAPPSGGGGDDAINVNYGQPVFKDGVQVAPGSQQVESTGSLDPAHAAAVVASTESNVKPVPEPSWIVLAGTAFAFSLFWSATRVIRAWLSRRRSTHSRAA